MGSGTSQYTKLAQLIARLQLLKERELFRQWVKFYSTQLLVASVELQCTRSTTQQVTIVSLVKHHALVDHEQRR